VTPSVPVFVGVHRAWTAPIRSGSSLLTIAVSPAATRDARRSTPRERRSGDGGGLAAGASHSRAAYRRHRRGRDPPRFTSGRRIVVPAPRLLALLGDDQPATPGDGLHIVQPPGTRTGPVREDRSDPFNASSPRRLRDAKPYPTRNDDKRSLRRSKTSTNALLRGTARGRPRSRPRHAVRPHAGWVTSGNSSQPR